MNKKLIKLLHIFLIMLISMIVITAIFNTTLLSKFNIMEIIDYALTITNTEMSPVDSLFIARSIRQQLWQAHYYLGIVLSCFSIIVYFLYSNSIHLNQKKIVTAFLNTAIIAYMSLIGVFLYYRKELNISVETFEILKDLHWFGIY